MQKCTTCQQLCSSLVFDAHDCQPLRDYRQPLPKKTCQRSTRRNQSNQRQSHQSDQGEAIPCEVCDNKILVDDYSAHIASHYQSNDIDTIYIKQNNQGKDNSGNGQRNLEQRQQQQSQEQSQSKPQQLPQDIRQSRRLQQQGGQGQFIPRQNQHNGIRLQQQLGQNRQTLADQQIERMTDEQLYEYFTNLDLNEKKGFDSKQLRKIQTFNYKGQEQPCLICQDIIQENQQAMLLECAHLFHSNCLKQWLEFKKLCPVCMKEVKI